MNELRLYCRELLELLPRTENQRILVVGDVILDEYLWGDAARLSAEAPVPVVEVRDRSYAAGGAANVAANIAALRGSVMLGGIVGQDPVAGRIRETLAGHGVEASGLVEDAARPTTRKTRLIAGGQQVVRIDHERRKPAARDVEDNLLLWVERRLPDVNACVLSDYGKGAVSERLAQQLLAAANHAGCPVVVDPKGTNYARYRGATVIKPNIHEVERVLQLEIRDDAAILQAGRQLLGVLEGTAVLVTRGDAGMSLFRADTLPFAISALAQHVFDTTGAGDTVVATLALFLAAGASLEQAVVAANLAASIAVTQRGTTAVTWDDLRQTMTRFG